MRNNMITVLAEDYVRMARAKGLSPWRIMWTYAGRNAILPNLAGFAMSLGFVVGGAILVEFVFNYPGVGWMFLQAVENQDYPLMQALFLMITVAVLRRGPRRDVATARARPAHARPAMSPAVAVADSVEPSAQPVGPGPRTRRPGGRRWARLARGPRATARRWSALRPAARSSSCSRSSRGQIAPYDPTAHDFEPRARRRRAHHWLGTTAYGQDVFAQLIWGTRAVAGDRRRGRRPRHR